MPNRDRERDQSMPSMKLQSSDGEIFEVRKACSAVHGNKTKKLDSVSGSVVIVR